MAVATMAIVSIPYSRSDPMPSQQRIAQRIAQTVWRCVHERLTESPGSITLQILCDEVRAAGHEPLEHRYVFHI